MITGQKDEKQLVDNLMSEISDSKREKIRNELIIYYETNYREELIRIIKSKYVLRTEDKNYASDDLYSGAMEIFLNNINKGKEIRQNGFFNYKAYMLAIARNLFLEKLRKDKEILVDTVPEYANALDEELREGNPFESEEEQKRVEDALVSYYIENDLSYCLEILENLWKKGLKNHEVAAILNIENPTSDDASRRVTVLHQICRNNAKRNIPVLEEIEKKYNIKRRKRHIWKKSHE